MCNLYFLINSVCAVLLAFLQVSIIPSQLPTKKSHQWRQETSYFRLGQQTTAAFPSPCHKMLSEKILRGEDSISACGVAGVDGRTKLLLFICRNRHPGKKLPGRDDHNEVPGFRNFIFLGVDNVVQKMVFLQLLTVDQ